ncbi:hypothetical protein HHK36_013793 [Tetracentron sinense]|uniref:AUGMIN subunit 8 n=1 Tax=Tetracentron sinense TaxID=13715 RepID=A0A834Z6T5_TETSI|nr:hypothetical protein HHK36_013793 [Tetracentron sinense]
MDSRCSPEDLAPVSGGLVELDLRIVVFGSKKYCFVRDRAFFDSLSFNSLSSIGELERKQQDRGQAPFSIPTDHGTPMMLMDGFEAEQAPRKGAEEKSARPPLVPSDKNNAVARRPRTREITSRYKAAITSPSPSTPAVSRRCLSPNVIRTISTPSPLLPKRSQSAERKRPSTPPSPPSPSTPVQHSSAAMQISSRRVMSGRTPDGLWPSTMRSLSVSFQSDTFSLPVSKKEKPVTHASSDPNLKPSGIVAHRQHKTSTVPRKATPERKRTPLRGKNASDQSENSKPVDNSHAGLVDQHRGSTRTSGKVSTDSLTRSMDLTDKSIKGSSLRLPGRGVSPPRKIPLYDGVGKPIQKPVSEVARRVSFDERGRVELGMCPVDDTSMRLSRSDKLVSSSGVSSSSSERTLLTTRTNRSQLSPSPGLRPPSPNKTSLLSPYPSRGMVSPSRTRPSNPYPSVITVTRLSNSTSSVLNSIADYRKGKKSVHIEDAHQLRLLYNTYLHWLFANARADAAMSTQTVTAEKTLSNVSSTISQLLNSVTMKRINLQQIKQELKLNSVLNGQMAYLDHWALLERGHSSSLSGAIEALEASVLRLPVTGGARADIYTMKNAVSSAFDVMQAMRASICCLLLRLIV